MDDFWWLIPAFFAIALLYASVGHGGASGYLAVLSLLPGAFHPGQMTTTALTLNLLVAGTAMIAFLRAGHFSPRLTWPFVVASVPTAFLGGLAFVSVRAYAVLLAASLAVAAVRLLIPRPRDHQEAVKRPALPLALLIGGAIGWLSGIVGVGGGIFLSPVLLLCRWADPKQTAASAACFILVNSLAGLSGRLARHAVEYGTSWPLLCAAFLGGVVGARLGANHFSGRTLKQLLAIVLLGASVKLFIVAWRMG